MSFAESIYLGGVIILVFAVTLFTTSVYVAIADRRSATASRGVAASPRPSARQSAAHGR